MKDRLERYMATSHHLLPIIITFKIILLDKVSFLYFFQSKMVDYLPGNIYCVVSLYPNSSVYMIH